MPLKLLVSTMFSTRSCRKHMILVIKSHFHINTSELCLVLGNHLSQNSGVLIYWSGLVIIKIKSRIYTHVDGTNELNIATFFHPSKNYYLPLYINNNMHFFTFLIIKNINIPTQQYVLLSGPRNNYKKLHLWKWNTIQYPIILKIYYQYNFIFIYLKGTMCNKRRFLYINKLVKFVN